MLYYLKDSSKKIDFSMLYLFLFAQDDLRNHHSIHQKYYLNEKLTPPISAACAICPSLWLFMKKTAIQQDRFLSKKDLFFDSIGLIPRTVPIIFCTIGLQNFSASNLELLGVGVFPASFLAATISSPLYTIFNGQGMKISMLESLKHMTFSQNICVIGRETMFVYSLRTSVPFCNYIMKSDYFREKPYIEWLSYFMVGFGGSILGHPFDCALTYYQMKSNIMEQVHKHSIFQAFTKGLFIRGLAVGSFNLFYQEAKKILNKNLVQ